LRRFLSPIIPFEREDKDMTSGYAYQA